MQVIKTAAERAKFLKHIAPDLPAEDQRRLLRFAAGFPQLARLIGHAWLSDIPIASATDDELIDRIIIKRKPRDLLGTKPPLDVDLAEAATFSLGRTADDLRAAFDELETRGVAQRRGRLVSLQPRPVALALAERQWRRWDASKWDNLLAGDVPRHLRTRIARQLALLNTKPIATDVVRHVCRLDGPFASLDGLSRDGNAEVLATLAEIDTEIVVTLLDHVLAALSDVE